MTEQQADLQEKVLAAYLVLEACQNLIDQFDATLIQRKLDKVEERLLLLGSTLALGINNTADDIIPSHGESSKEEK